MEIDHLSAGYRKLIEAAPFVAIATGGPDGFDCSPKGDAAGFVRVIDDKTLAIPDRPGNNRLDGFRNILCDLRIALLFLIPGVGETFRGQRQAAAQRADRSHRVGVFPLLEGDRALETVGSGHAG